jgi:hypothetical protein
MTLTVNDAVFQVLQPMVQQHTIDSFLTSVLADRHLYEMKGTVFYECHRFFRLA